MKKLISLMLCLSMLLPAAVMGAAGVNAAETEKTDTLSTLRENSYQTYYKRYLDKDRPLMEIPLDNAAAVLDDKATLHGSYKDRTNVIEWNGRDSKLEYTVNIPQEGCYALKVEFMPLDSESKIFEFGMMIDGAYPFQSAEKMELNPTWESINDTIQQDRYGNDRLPRQKLSELWTTQIMLDPDGVSYEPVPFYFTAGTHTITLTSEIAEFYISGVTLLNEKELPTYEEYLADLKQQGVVDEGAEEIYIEAESATYRSDSTLIPASDRTSGKTSPSSPESIKLNTIGGGWSDTGEWMSWQFEVKKTGYYQIGFRFRQESLRGFFVTRRIYIDGEIPYQELADTKFFYKTGWQYEFAGNDEPFTVYLEAGTHELKMDAILGEFSDALWELDESFYQLNYIYRKIIMITGREPDVNRDYFLEEQIPGLCESFISIAESIETQAERIESIADTQGSEAAFLYEISDQLRSFADKPDTIKKRLSQFSSNIESLSSWVLEKKAQPLTLDYIKFTPVGAEKDKADDNFFQNIAYRFLVFLSSFVTDYERLGDVDPDEVLLVWVSAGTEQADILRDIISDEFIPEYGIEVNLQLVQGTLIEATLAGKGPDIALSIDRTTPVNLAARGALIDFSKYEDFEEVKSRFAPNATLPYEFNGGCYGLPSTQNFNMMFYRTDIFEELGLEPPQTWEELDRVIAVLQANNMQAGIGSVTTTTTAVSSTATTTVNADIFASLLMQKGLSYYNDDLSETNFSQPEAVEAFEEWTQFYTQTTLPVTFDFYNRFRSGEMPLGIQPYTMYNMIAAAAPEIRGMWEMVPIPGTPDENGNINRTSNANGTGSIVFKSVKNEEDAWEFMKWWTSAETQERYGSDLEMLLGSAARYDTANLEAFEKLAWTPKEIDALTAQWKNVQEIPETPASYYMTRGLSNAFRNVVYNYENPRESLFYQNKLINKELESKRTELGLE